MQNLRSTSHSRFGTVSLGDLLFCRRPLVEGVVRNKFNIRKRREILSLLVHGLPSLRQLPIQIVSSSNHHIAKRRWINIR
jgi:hypothetical protein